MDSDLAKYFIDETKEIKATQIEILQRLTRIEEKSKSSARITGGLSGLVVALIAILVDVLIRK